MQRTVFSGLFRFALVFVVWLGPGMAPLALGELVDSSKAAAAGCPTVPSTPSFTFTYGVVQLDGANAAVGTVVETLSPRGDVAACFEVTDSGAYGAMYIYGEDGSIDPPIPGMRDGEMVSFHVDGVLASASPALAWHNDRDLHQTDLDAQTLVPLNSPSNLSAWATSQTEIGVSWQDNSSGESGFQVERSTDGGQNWSQAGATAAGATTYDDVGRTCGATYHYRVRAYRDSDGSYSGYSNVDNATTDACEGGSLELMVSQSTDDAEEKLTDGDMALKSVDLELGVDRVAKLVGLRFLILDIPQGASVSSASVVFTADETHDDDTDLVFHGQDSDDTAAFASGAGDLSSRPQTSASVAWNNVAPWSTVHDTYSSPDLSPIIQEIVNRSGWAPGNSLVLLVEGSGKRTAESYNGAVAHGDATLAPRLLVEFGSGQPPTCYGLALSHTGSGSDPVPSPASSQGCAGGQYVAGQIVNLTASPSTGWAVTSWSGTGNDGGTATTNQVTMPAAGHATAVNYVEQQVDCYALTLGHTGSGGDPLASPASSQGCAGGQYVAGQIVNLNASPSTGWAVTSWSGTDNDSSTATTNQVTMPAAGHATAVHYVEQQVDCYALTLGHTGSGGDPLASPASSQGCPGGQYVAGQTIDLSASPSTGWAVTSWSGTDNDSSTATTNQVTMPAASHSAAVNYAEAPPGGSVDVMVGDSRDDAEEKLTGGDMALKSVDLELGVDRVAKLVGLRFLNLDIPQGATITSAAIVFTADETHDGDTDLVLHGQDSDDTAAFGSSDGNLSSRPQTSASVAWNKVAPWSTVHDTYSSPDLSPIIQEIVNRSGWAPGNSLVLLVEGSGKRTAESYNGAVAHGDATLAPRLLVEFGSGQPPTCYSLALSHTGSGGDPVPSPASSQGCAGGQYVAGQIVNLNASPSTGWTVASWSGTDNDGSTATTNQVTMPATGHSAAVNYVEQQVDCYALTLGHTGSGGDPLASPASSQGCAGGQYVAGQIVNLNASPSTGWAVTSWSGTDNDSSTATTNQVTMPAAGHATAVNYTEAPPGGSVDVMVSDSRDDAEEKLTGGDMALKSVDLELGVGRVAQIVGLRFLNMDIPQGATITSAAIVFSADEIHDGDTNLILHGQDSDDAAAFANGAGDLSSRPQTSASVAWNDVAPWSTVHATHPSPDLSPIIQEIVNRSGWTPGNSLVILIEGSGTRTAESFDGEPNLAPRLLVEFGSSLPPPATR